MVGEQNYIYNTAIYQIEVDEGKLSTARTASSKFKPQSFIEGLQKKADAQNTCYGG